MDLISLSIELKNIDNKNSYTERVWLSIFVIIGFILIEGILIAVTVTTSIKVPATMTITIPICSGIGLLLLLIFINYSSIRITINESEINVKYGVFNKKTIQIDELISYGGTNASIRIYLGFGVRIGTDGSIAFTTRFGKAIRFESADKRPLVVSTNNPEKIITFIDQIKGK